MRVLLFPSSYLPVAGGLQIAVHQLGQALVGRGHQVLVVTNRFPRALAQEDYIDGIHIIRLPLLFPSWSHVTRGRVDLALAAPFMAKKSHSRFASIMDEFKPEIIHVHFPLHQVQLLARTQAKLPPVIVTFHGHDIERFRNNTAKDSNETEAKSLRLLLQQSAAVTVCSHYLLESVQTHFPIASKKLTCVRNGISSVFHPNGRAYKHSRPYIFAFGRLTHVKGFDLLARAFSNSSLPDQGYDLLIAGDGEELPRLRAMVDQRNNGVHVTFLGQRSPVELAELLRGCSFAVVPSRNEGFGMAALESLLSGKPIIATNVGGMHGVLNSFVAENIPSDRERNENPVLFSEPEPKSLECALEIMLVEFEQRMRWLVQIERGCFDWITVARTYEEIYADSRFAQPSNLLPNCAMSVGT